jgi:hypothetical protein
MLLALPGTALAAPLDNDNFLDAQRLAFFERDATADRTNAGAGIQADEPLTINETPVEQGCGASASQLSHTIWYEIIGDGGAVTVHTRGSEVDTVVAVYDTDAAPASPDPSADEGASNFIGCNDDITASDRDSEVTFNTAANVGYLVQVGGCAGCGLTEEGSVEFVAYNEPLNDDRAQAIQLSAGAAPTEDDNFGATLETGERAACATGGGSVPFGRTIWYRYRAPGSGTAVFTTSGIDTVLSVYRGSTFLGCNDDGPGQSTASRLPVAVTAGDYFVQVGGIGVGRDADYGGINAQVAFTPAPPSDRDGDGVPDASDRCPDQNAAARDANRDGCLDPDLDPDRDGVPVPTDKCPTQNAAGRDTNRDGCLDPLPRKRISADASLRATPTGNGIRVRWLRVKAPKGARITVRCGVRCRFAKRASTPGSGKPLAVAAKTVTVKKLAGRSFRAGQKIRIYVTRKNRIGVYIQYTVRRGNFKRVKRCLNPGSMKPRKRCR